MKYRDMCGEEVSALGLGCMRLPKAGPGPAEIDVPAALEMADMLVEGGVTYVDTAYSYHDGASERFVGEMVRRYGRSRLRLATKMPGHEIRPEFNPVPIFERQLARTGAGHFDFYLMHNVSEMSFPRYTDADLGVLEFLVEQKRRGLIRHLGFSAHAQLGTLERFLEYCDAKAPGEVEFVQLQLNYADWLLQDGAAKYDLVRDAGLDVVVMEPLRGGALTQLEGARADEMAGLMKACGAASAAEVAFRWLFGLDRVKVILSGMSAGWQAEDNLRIFDGCGELGPDERAAVDAFARRLADMQPCTGCRYCTRECPMGFDIPLFLKLHDEGKLRPSINMGMRIDALPPEQRPGQCLGCGACAEVCPQGIDIPRLIAELNDILAKVPSWAAVSAARVAAERAENGTMGS